MNAQLWKELEDKQSSNFIGGEKRQNWDNQFEPPYNVTQLPPGVVKTGVPYGEGIHPAGFPPGLLEVELGVFQNGLHKGFEASPDIGTLPPGWLQGT